MQQELWHDTVFDAIGAAVQASGGVKHVSHKLWPSLSADVAAARLRAGLNPEHAQKLCIEEILLIAKLAKEQGDNSIGEYFARDVGYEFKSLTPAESKRRAKKQRISTLLAEVARLTAEDAE